MIKNQQPGMMIHPAEGVVSPAVAAADAAASGATRRQQRAQVGLLRVGIDAKLVEGHMRGGALEGRLIVTTGSKKTAGLLPGAAYRLLATDAGGQFAELLAVLGVSDAVEAGGSRCGICNGDDWHTLRPNQVAPGQVPEAVRRSQRLFYLCGRCQQIFWPGDKYESTMEGLRDEVGRDEPGGAAEPEPERASYKGVRAGTGGGVWRPPSGTVDGVAMGASSPAATASASIGQQLRQGTLHSSQRMQFGLG